MKKLFTKFLIWLQSFKEQVSDIKKTDRKNTIMDQILFGLSTEESIQLYNAVTIAFNEEMQTRKNDAIKEYKSIISYFRENIT